MREQLRTVRVKRRLLLVLSIILAYGLGHFVTKAMHDCPGSVPVKAKPAVAGWRSA